VVEEDASTWDWGRFREIARESDCLFIAYVGLRRASLSFGAPVTEEFLQDFRAPSLEAAGRGENAHPCPALTGPAPGIPGGRVARLRWLLQTDGTSLRS